MSDGRFKKGHITWCAKPKFEKTCPKCGTIFYVKPSLDRVVHCSQSCAKRGQPSPRKGCKVSPETREKQRQAKLELRGPEHWNWRGGKTTERKRAMARDEYVQWRKAVFDRDNYTCQFCGARGVELHADHIKPWAQCVEDRYDVANGRALCPPCHHTTPSFPKQLVPKEAEIVR
jgi:5-methylcytosine-specific restriction endonuclease McrA